MSERRKLTPEFVQNALKEMKRLQNSYSIWPGQYGGFPGRLAFATPKSLDPPNRDIPRECGYPVNPNTAYFGELIEQYGIADRANSIWPDETWGRPPLIYETYSENPAEKTGFEQDLEELLPRTNLIAMLHRVDQLCYGRYSCLLYGFSDLGPTDKFDQPAPGIDSDTGNEIPGNKAKVGLNYLMAYSEMSMTVLEVENRPGSPRFNQPKYYQLAVTTPSGAATSERVHWSRVQHFVSTPSEHIAFGKFRLKSSLPFIYDLRKVGGSSAEMFWKSGFPIYQYVVTVDPMLGMPDLDVAAIKEDIQALINGLQRFLTAENGEWKALAPGIADPTPHITQQLNLLCATLGVPLMVFLGSMSGQLASNQNVGNWRDRVAARQSNLIDPFLLRPTLERLTRVGVLRRPKQIITEWSDLHALSGKERADVALKLTQALNQFVTGKIEAIFPVLYYMTQILGLPNAMVTKILSTAKSQKPMTLDLFPAPIPANTAGSGGRTGTAPRRSAGRPTGSV